MKYPIHEKHKREEQYYLERYQNACKEYVECNDWCSFRVKVDLIGLPKILIAIFWLYYLYNNRGWFPIIMMILPIPILVGILTYMASNWFIAISIAMICSMIAIGFALCLKENIFPTIERDIYPYEKPKFL